MLSTFGPLLWLHLPYLLSVAALALRNQVKLRAVLLASVAVGACEDLVSSPGPDFQSLFWNLVNLVINLTVLIQIAMDRIHVGLSEDEKHLFRAFDLLTPGEFRAILKLGTWCAADAGIEITREGVRPEFLFYVVEGTIAIEKSGRSIAIAPPTFVGEIAFLHRRPASATVRVAPGCRYVSWPVAVLDRRIAGQQALKHAMIRLISADMARKVTRT